MDRIHFSAVSDVAGSLFFYPPPIFNAGKRRTKCMHAPFRRKFAEDDKTRQHACECAVALVEKLPLAGGWRASCDGLLQCFDGTTFSMK